jgi:hypothetical protein
LGFRSERLMPRDSNSEKEMGSLTETPKEKPKAKEKARDLPTDSAKGSKKG